MYESFSNSGENNPKLYSEERDDKDNHHDCSNNKLLDLLILAFATRVITRHTRNADRYRNSNSRRLVSELEILRSRFRRKDVDSRGRQSESRCNENS